MGAGASTGAGADSTTSACNKRIEKRAQGSTNDVETTAGPLVLIPVVSMKQLNDLLAQQEADQADSSASAIVPTTAQQQPPVASFTVPTVSLDAQKELDKELFKSL